MVKRQIIEIDEDLCNGCRKCIPNCPEGAIQIIDGKARLISDLFCDGLGACVGHCPTGAINIIEREAVKYDEKRVMENIVKKGPNTIRAHLMHLKEHGETEYLREAISFLKKRRIPIPPPLPVQKPVIESGCSSGGCPGSREVKIELDESENSKDKGKNITIKSELKQWPIQLHLVNSYANFFNNADLLIAADCVGFSYPNFHQKLLKGKILVIGCPKLDEVSEYQEKLSELFKNTKIKSVTVAIMEVPCCAGLSHIVEEAISESKKKIPYKKIVIGINGKEM